MNNPNPFVPQGSLLEQQSKRRSRLKLAVFCVLAVLVAGLSAMLIQGCKREQPTDNGETPTIDTNTPSITDTNAPTIDTNAPAMPPVATNAVVTPPPDTAGAEYTVVKGDTLAAIAKKNGVTTKALEAANPGVVPTKLKIG
ncbi:MAG TPA: LysM peptidoglycan-binding domain-containing protein, partial [Verrucomicrobiae bacterium]